MAQPHPPQGAQQAYTERPLRVYGEQYLAGEPLPVGVVIDPGDPAAVLRRPAARALPTGWVVVARRPTG